MTWTIGPAAPAASLPEPLGALETSSASGAGGAHRLRFEACPFGPAMHGQARSDHTARLLHPRTMEAQGAKELRATAHLHGLQMHAAFLALSQS